MTSDTRHEMKANSGVRIRVCVHQECKKCCIVDFSRAYKVVLQIYPVPPIKMYAGVSHDESANGHSLHKRYTGLVLVNIDDKKLQRHDYRTKLLKIKLRKLS